MCLYLKAQCFWGYLRDASPPNTSVLIHLWGSQAVYPLSSHVPKSTLLLSLMSNNSFILFHQSVSRPLSLPLSVKDQESIPITLSIVG